MDLINVQMSQKKLPFYMNTKGGYLNLIARIDWGFKKAIAYNSKTKSYVSFPISDEPIIGLSLEKRKMSNYEFNIEDLFANDWVIFSEENMKKAKQEIFKC